MSVVFRYDTTTAIQTPKSTLGVLLGAEQIAVKGAIIKRNGKRWEGAEVNKQEKVTTPRAIPIYRYS